MHGLLRAGKATAVASACVVTLVGAGRLGQARARVAAERPDSSGPVFGPTTVHRAVAHDTSPALASLGQRTEGGTPQAPPSAWPSRPGSRMARTEAPHRTAEQVEQKRPGTEPAARLVTSFDGLGEGFEGPQGTRHSRNPSDNSLAVGPDNIFQIVNGFGMAVYTKKGKKYGTTGRVLFGPVPVNDVFKGFGGDCEARNSGDAVVRYDQLAGRWLIVLPMFSRNPYRPDQPEPFTPADGARRSVVGVPGQPGGPAIMYQPAPPPPETRADSIARRARFQHMRERLRQQRQEEAQGPQGVWAMCYAVSMTSDPLGAYYRYEFLRPYFPDYPRPAVWPDGYYIPTSSGDHRISDSIATQKHACVADRRAMLEGKPATEQCVIVENVSFLNNADVDGMTPPPAGAPNIMMAAGGRQLDSIFADSVINVWQYHVDWKDPSNTKITGPTPIKVAPYHFLCDGQLSNCVPQPGVTRRLDSQGDKLMQRLVYRRFKDHESILATHSINTAEGGGGVRWYEFRVDPKSRHVSLYQQGTYLGDGDYRWMASGTIDKFGNIGIGYSFGGPHDFPGQRFTGRKPGDPLGQLTFKEAILAQGEAAQTDTERWQDYTTAALDPSDDCTVWYVGDYLKKGATDYSTKIGAFQMPGCGE
jgi:hypothetical protein